VQHQTLTFPPCLLQPQSSNTLEANVQNTEVHFKKESVDVILLRIVTSFIYLKDSTQYADKY